jgi:hypothetical protein
VGSCGGLGIPPPIPGYTSSSGWGCAGYSGGNCGGCGSCRECGNSRGHSRVRRDGCGIPAARPRELEYSVGGPGNPSASRRHGGDLYPAKTTPAVPVIVNVPTQRRDRSEFRELRKKIRALEEAIANPTDSKSNQIKASSDKKNDDSHHGLSKQELKLRRRLRRRTRRLSKSLK